MMSSKNVADDLESAERKKKWGCWSFGCLFLVVGPLCLIGSLVIFFVGRDRAAAARLNEYVAKLESQGLPYDNASLGKYYNDLTSDEKVAEWLRYLDVLNSEELKNSAKGVPLFDGEVEYLPPVAGQAWAPEDASRKFLDRWQNVYTGLRDLSLDQLHPDARPVRFQKKFDGFLTELNTQQSMRQVARLLQLHATLSIIDRDALSTRVDIEALMGCADAMAAEPHLIGQLIQIACDGIANGVLKSAIEEDVLDARHLSILFPKLLPRQNISKLWKVAILGERAAGLEAFRNPSTFGEPGLANVPMRSRDALYYAEFMGGLLDIPDDDVNRFLGGLQAEEGKLMAMMNSGPLVRFDSLLTGTVTPAIGSAGQANARRMISYRLATLAIGIRLFEKKHGKFPASLEELSEFKIDISKITPTGQKPFGYQVVDTQAIVWGPPARPSFDINVSTPDSPPVMDAEWQTSDPGMLWLIPAGSR